MKLAYWNLKGRAFAIRCLLKYADVDFEDFQYTRESAIQWFVEDKPALYARDDIYPLNMPSNPYLIDGEYTIFQSGTILRYVGRKTGLSAKTDEGKLIEDVIWDVFTQLTDGKDGLMQARWVTSEDPEVQTKELEKVWSRFPEILSRINRILVRNKTKFLTGETPSWIDFVVLTMYDIYFWFQNKKDQLMPTAEAAKPGDLNYEILKMILEIYSNQKVKEYYDSVIEDDFMVPVGNGLAKS